MLSSRLRNNLVQQANLTISGRTKATQVTRLKSESGQLANQRSHHERICTVLLLVATAPNQLAPFDLSQRFFVDTGSVEQLFAS